MAKPESQPFWLNNDSFNGNGPVEPDEQSGLVTFEPASSSQFSADLAFDLEQYELSIQDLQSSLGPVYAQPDGIHGTAVPFPMDNTHFSSPVGDHTAKLDKGIDSSSANNCGASITPPQFLKTGRSDSQRMGGFLITSANMIVDSNAIKLCDYWLQLYPNVYPKDADIHALSQLTGQPPASIERWLNNKIRSVSSSSHDSGIGSSKSSMVSSIISSETSTSGEATLIEMAPPQIPHRDLNNGASGRGPVFTEVDSRSRLVFDVPATWTTSPLVKESLAKAEWSSRARISCHPTSNSADLVRNPYKPLQCTRKCGYATAPKKDWKRHESRAFPQKGFLCTLPPAIRIGNDTFCVYCPAESRQLNPTIAHMKSEHRLTFSADCDLEMTLCNQVCHRREHLKTHFGKIHPGIHPDAWVRMAAFDVRRSAFPKYCGFCRKTLTSWNERIDHIQVHFERDGLDMRQWQDFDDSDDHRRNKRHRRDDDADDRSDSGDSDEDDDDDFGKRSSGAGKCGNVKKHNTRAQPRSDRFSQRESHYHGTSSSDGDAVSEEEHTMAPSHVYDWLKNVSRPGDSRSARKAMGGHTHSLEYHLHNSGQDMSSHDETKHNRGKTARKTHLASLEGFDRPAIMGTVSFASPAIILARDIVRMVHETVKEALVSPKLPNPNHDASQKYMKDTSKLKTTWSHLRKTWRSQSRGTPCPQHVAEVQEVRIVNIFGVRDSGGGIPDVIAYKVICSSSLRLGKTLSTINFGCHPSDGKVITASVTGVKKASFISRKCGRTPGKFNIAPCDPPYPASMID